MSLKNARAKREFGEKGLTLVEMSVAMLIMGILMTMVMSGIVHLTRTTQQVQAVRDASNQLDLAFLTLDGEVRYAYEIWSPYAGAPATDDTWDVEFESTYNGASNPTCTELQYNYSTGTLLQASWTSGSVTTPPYKALATGLTGTSDPFQIISNPSYEEVQLEVTLTAAAGTGSALETSSSSVTFTALNSSSNQPASSSDLDCTTTWTPA